MSLLQPLVVSPVAAAGAPAALSLLLQDLPSEDRARQTAEWLAEATAPNAWTGLWTACRGEHVTGAIWVRPQPGGTAVLWPPRLIPGEPAATAADLLAAGCQAAFAGGARLLQALLDPAQAADRERLAAAGFQSISELVYLCAFEHSLPQQQPTGPLTLEAYTPANHARLAAALAATYEGTLDCPALNGVRTMEDVLAGYRATGEFSPQRWLLAQHAGQDAGCLLLADHPAPQDPELAQFELVYMGLAPQSRGHGGGRQLVRHALWLTRQAGRPRLCLAVDAENAPALHAYRSAGMIEFARRLACLAWQA